MRLRHGRIVYELIDDYSLKLTKVLMKKDIFSKADESEINSEKFINTVAGKSNEPPR